MTLDEMSRSHATARPVVVTASSSDREPATAVTQLRTRLGDIDPSLLAVFVSSSFPYAQIVPALTHLYPHTTIVGCTTAGALSAEVYEADGIAVVAFDRSVFSFSVSALTNLGSYSMAEGGRAIETAYFELLRKLEPEHENFFAMLLIDGMSRREEEIAASAYAALDEVPIFGASAGDNLDFATTQVFHDGQILEDAALVVIGASSRRVEVFKCQHFLPTDRKMVVTDAEPDRRLVRSINAEPAAEEYARVIGVEVGDLNPEVSAARRLLVRLAGEYHIRAVQKADESGALHFYCSVDCGSVLTLARPQAMYDNLVQSMEQLSDRLNGIDMVLCFDCILRRLEAERLDIKEDLLSVFACYNMIGFNTYGEQYRFLHLSQTLTGLAIGRQS